MDSLDFPLSVKTKQAILGIIFDYNSEGSIDPAVCASNDSYFSYYRRAVERGQSYRTLDTHQDIANLVRVFKRPGVTRDSAEDTLRERLLDHALDDREEILEYWIGLATQLLLMMPTGRLLTTRRPITVSGETKLNWTDGTVKDLVNTVIVHQTAIKESVKLEKNFNARNLERIAGVEVRWTSNLADHLRMRDDDTAVEIFHYASFLRFHENCRIDPLDDQAEPQILQAQSYTIYPPAFIDETLRTLALLLPEHDKDIEKWFRAHQTKLQKRRKLPLDPLARECGQLKVKERQIENFEYWHDRLVILKQVFDEAEPSNIKQWWYDRRRRVQWYTFWVAALVLGLTIIFGLIQCVEGALQVYLATGRPLGEKS